MSVKPLLDRKIERIPLQISGKTGKSESFLISSLLPSYLGTTESDILSELLFYKEQITESDVQKIKQILKKEPQFINMRSDIGNTPLLAAIKRALIYTSLDMKTRTELFSLAKYLIKHGDKVNARNNLLETPLNIILSTGYILGIEGNPNPNVVDDIINDIIFENIEDIVKLLINHGADVNAINSYDDSPLHEAIFMDFESIVELLLNHGARVDVKDFYGNTPLFSAVLNDSKEIVKLLIEHGADVNTKGAQNNTPLHVAKSKDIAELLVDNGAKVNVTNDEGLTPLMNAIMNNKTNVVKYLKIITDPNIRSNKSKNALELASELGTVNILDLLPHYTISDIVMALDTIKQLNDQDRHIPIIERYLDFKRFYHPSNTS